MPFGIGVTELIILLVVLLVFFGPKRLPEMGRSLGKGMREFKDSISGKDDDEPVHRRLASELPPAEGPVDRIEPADAPPVEAPRRTESTPRDTVS